MKKAIIALLAVAAVVGLRSAAGRSGQKVREHCKQMAGKCKQMMAEQSTEPSGAAGMREHCKEMMAAHDEIAEKHERPEQAAPQFEGQGEAITV